MNFSNIKDKLNKHKSKIIIGIFIIAGLVFAVSAYKVISELSTDAKERSAFENLAEIVERAKQDIADNPGENDSDDEGVLPEYAELYNLNNDFYAWITIDGTNINYPVMQSKNDPEFYLHRAFDKSDAVSGTPFIDSNCTEEGNLFIVYGHHRTTGHIFAVLPEYANKDFWEAHKTIKFDTIHERGKYEIIAAFYSKIYDGNQDGFRYYNYKELKDEETFNSYMEQIKANAVFDTGLTAEYGDKLLVLSTCNYHTKNGRFAVVARKI